jgi:hypothetical protein
VDRDADACRRSSTTGKPVVRETVLADSASATHPDAQKQPAVSEQPLQEVHSTAAPNVTSSSSKHAQASCLVHLEDAAAAEAYDSARIAAAASSLLQIESVTALARPPAAAVVTEQQKARDACHEDIFPPVESVQSSCEANATTSEQSAASIRTTVQRTESKQGAASLHQEPQQAPTASKAGGSFEQPPPPSPPPPPPPPPLPRRVSMAAGAPPPAPPPPKVSRTISLPAGSPDAGSRGEGAARPAPTKKTVRLFWKKVAPNVAEKQGKEGSVWADVAGLPVRLTHLCLSLMHVHVPVHDL